MRELFTTPINSPEGYGSVLREPTELYMPDRNSCMSCVVANVLFMYGKVNEPDVVAVDAELGRQPGEPLPVSSSYQYLLHNGFSMEFIDVFDEEAFITKGLSYLQQFYKDTWSGPSFDNYWTPEKVHERQEARRQSRDEFNAYSDQVSSTVKSPSVHDIDTFLDSGKVVIAQFDSENENGLRHTVLIYGKDSDGYYKLYSPRTKTSHPYDVTLFGAGRDYLSRNLLPDEGIVGLTLKSDSSS